MKIPRPELFRSSKRFPPTALAVGILFALFLIADSPDTGPAKADRVGGSQMGSTQADGAAVTDEAPAVTGSGYPRGYHVESREPVIPGVTLTRLRLAGPNHVEVLRIDPSSGVSMDVDSAHDHLPGFEHTSDIATRNHAVAAVNGDFGLYPGRPAHAFIEDGVLKQTSVLGMKGKNFGIRQDQTAAYIGKPPVTITIDTPSGPPKIVVSRWNVGAPRNIQVSGYSAFGGSLARPPAHACSARLIPTAPGHWNADGTGITRPYRVNTRICRQAPILLSGGIVIASGTSGFGAQQMHRLIVGDEVELTWSLGWKGVTDAVGGSPILVDAGAVVVHECNTWLCVRQPRTVVGITADGTILLVSINGRAPHYSVGMSLVQTAAFMKTLGARWALNLDGGGSATMWVRGKGIVNRPSDGSERGVACALFVRAGADPGEPDLGPLPAAAAR